MKTALEAAHTAAMNKATNQHSNGNPLEQVIAAYVAELHHCGFIIAPKQATKAMIISAANANSPNTPYYELYDAFMAARLFSDPDVSERQV